MNISDFFQQLSVTQIITFCLVFAGLPLFIISILTTRRFHKILIKNDYNSNKWLFIIGLISVFVIAYISHGLVVFEYFETKIDPILLVSVVYFLGAIFIFATMRTTLSMVQSIFGDNISDENATEIFLEIVKIDKNVLIHLEDDFNFQCDKCNKTITYSIADVIRQHSKLDDKGVIVESTFGVKSIILRPNHKCTNGLREVVTIHDHNLALRSVDKSKIILSSNL